MGSPFRVRALCACALAAGCARSSFTQVAPAGSPSSGASHLTDPTQPTRWASEGYYPLAEVRTGVLSDLAHCRQPLEGGERFLAVDAWGTVAGEVELVTEPRWSFRVVSGSDGSGVFVQRERWSARSTQWSPDDTTIENAEAWLSAELPERTEVRFFRATGSTPRYFLTAVGPNGFLIGGVEPDGWQVMFRHTEEQPAWQPAHIASIVDMEEDGSPEVVVHYNEFESGDGHEQVLRLSADASSFELVAENADVCP